MCGGTVSVEWSVWRYSECGVCGGTVSVECVEVQ